eukprot:1152335-Pelagomonas_calceolata.AAC.1
MGFDLQPGCLAARPAQLFQPHKQFYEIGDKTAEETLPKSVKENRHIGSKEPQVPSTAEQEQKELVRIWRVARSTQLQDLAVRSIIVFNNVPSGYNL